MKVKNKLGKTLVMLARLHNGSTAIHIVEGAVEHGFKADTGMLLIDHSGLAGNILDHIAGIDHDAGHSGPALHLNALRGCIEG